MKSNKWKEFLDLSQECYLTLTGAHKDRECWDKAFRVLKEIVTAERSEHPERIMGPYQLDEDTDYEYDVQGWLDDFLDDLDMHEEYEKLLNVCEELLELFLWEKGGASDIKFVKTSALHSLGRNDEAVRFCRQWLSEDEDNIYAVAANIYANTAVRDMESAEELIRRHIPEGTQCTHENDMLFTAAATCYEEVDDQKKKVRIDQEIAAYERRIIEYYMGDGSAEPPF